MMLKRNLSFYNLGQMMSKNNPALGATQGYQNQFMKTNHYTDFKGM